MSAEPRRLSLVGGGSGAIVSRRGDNAVKQARDPVAKAKIDDEREWLAFVMGNAPFSVKQHFVTVVKDRHRAQGELVMSWLEGPTARTAALCGSLDVTVVEDALEAALRVLTLQSATDTTMVVNWWRAQLDERLKGEGGIPLTMLFTAPQVALSGGFVQNPLYGGVARILECIEEHLPPRLGFVHGDLHLGNLMLSAANHAQWIDPRGTFGQGFVFDAAYDVAKLLHEAPYVATRAEVVRPAGIGMHPVALRTRADKTTGEDLRSLRRLGNVNLALATRYCERIGVDDPLLAARSTLYTGLLFLTVAPFCTPSEATVMLTSAVLWLRSGLDALQWREGLHMCRSRWRELLRHIGHHAAQAASPEVIHAAELR